MLFRGVPVKLQWKITVLQRQALETVWCLYVSLKGTRAACIRIHPVYLFIALQSAGVLAIG